MFRSTLVASVILLWAGITGLGQAPTSDDWVRVGSDDGEFSIEVPRAHVFFRDEHGFSVAGPRGDLPLRKMEMANAYVDGSLVSFERYHTSKAALERIFESDKGRRGVTGVEELKRPGGKMQQIVSRTEKFYMVRRYFYTKDHAYILTAASHTDETPVTKYFLESLTIDAKAENGVAAGVTAFSSLQAASLEIEDLTEKRDDSHTPADTSQRQVQLKPRDPADKPIVIMNNPPASYVEQARAARIKGTVVVRVQFDETGLIPKISVLQGLPNGLTRQAVFNAFRMKYLPEERNGKVQAVVKRIEYTFSVY